MEAVVSLNYFSCIQISREQSSAQTSQLEGGRTISSIVSHFLFFLSCGVSRWLHGQRGGGGIGHDGLAESLEGGLLGRRRSAHRHSILSHSLSLRVPCKDDCDCRKSGRTTALGRRGRSDWTVWVEIGGEAPGNRRWSIIRGP